WLALSYPRCLHVGRCEGVSFRAEKLEVADLAQICNASADLSMFISTWVAPWFNGGPLASSFSLRPPNVARTPRTAWRIAEGLAKCRARYVPDPSTGKLAGVAVTNHTMPMKFAELCATILKPVDASQDA
ncbi:MAG: hypothetical protein SGPRY_003267, partial [Prymnesium sp.]